jgi:type 1 glutamine amidotransferase
MAKKCCLAALAGVVLAGLLLGPASPSVRADDKIKVVIIDGRNNHDWRATTPHMQRVLEQTGRFTVDVSTMPQLNGKMPPGKNRVPFPPDLGRYDVVLSNYNNIFENAPWPVELQKSLEAYLEQGKGGLVIVHGANNAHKDWKEYNRMIGMGWRDNTFGDRLIVDADGKEVRVPKGKGPGASHGPRHPFLITIRDADHPITRGMPREWLHATDELYHGMRGPIEDVHLLATAYSDKKYGGTGEHEPMIWTVTYGKGRVFHTPMGHDLEAMRCVGFITTLGRGTEWAATGKVTLPIPDNFPTADKTRSVPAKGAGS